MVLFLDFDFVLRMSLALRTMSLKRFSNQYSRMNTTKECTTIGLQNMAMM
jgi:hypothetical protein